MDDIVIYAAGEIHSEWREELRGQLEKLDVEADVVGPQEVHDRSDSVGEDILGAQPGPRYRARLHAKPRPHPLPQSAAARVGCLTLHSVPLPLPFPEATRQPRRGDMTRVMASEPLFA